MWSNEDENSANTTYNNIFQAHREAAELHVSHKPRNKKSLWEDRKVVQKRGALQDILKGTSQEVRPKASRVEDAKDLDRAYAEKQGEFVEVKILEIEHAHESYKTSLAWPVVNEIS